MNKNPLYENAIIIAPPSEAGFFAAYKEAYPEQHFDVLSVEEVEEMFKTNSPDPYAFFKGRNIVIRGYSDGRRIANAIEPLPNISLSWDILP